MLFILGLIVWAALVSFAYPYRYRLTAWVVGVPAYCLMFVFMVWFR